MVVNIGNEREKTKEVLTQYGYNVNLNISK